MKTIQLTFRTHQSIGMLASQLHIDPIIDCLEQVINLPSTFGKGKITGFEFSDGIGLLLFDCQFREDWTIIFTQDIIPPLQFNFSIKGGVRHFYNHNGIQYSLNPLQGTITADAPQSHHGFQFSKSQHVVFACLMIDREKYLQKVNCFIKDIPSRLSDVFSDTLAQKTFFYQGNYSLTSSECIQIILADKHIGLVRSTYLEGITLELLSNQIKQFRDDSVAPSKQVTIRKHDVEIILIARDFLIDNLSDPPTIEALAKKVGINQTKLKTGFRKIFDKPIKTWLRDKKLEMAKLLILEGQLSIKEVSKAIGYTNQGHFATRFKEKYGVLPKDFSQSIKTKLSDFK